MATLLERMLGRRRQPGDPAIICGMLSPGEQVDIGPLRIVNDDGDLHWTVRSNVLSCGVSLDGQLTITGLDGHDDEGVCLGRPAAGSRRWSFVADVRPERAVVFSLAKPPRSSLPLVSVGQGEYRRDWPGGGTGNPPKARRGEEPGTGERQDQASGLRAAVAQGGLA